ncbi:hypothetical protein QT995_20120 [Microcoleus sp. S36b_A3]|uniref:hypothetical protein n=1 Tax=unclassified Microcoleus TaxID=2642155 RepID=UPI002FD1BF22
MSKAFISSASKYSRRKEEGRKKEKGSSATSNVRDVTDVSSSEEGRRTQEKCKCNCRQ